MDESEFATFQHEYFEAFPGTLAWLREASPDVAGTLMVWRKTLAGTPLEYARRVLDEMISGVTPPPAAYERDKTALLIRERAGRLRQEDREFRSSERRREEYRRATGSEKSPWPAGSLYRQILALYERGRGQGISDGPELVDWVNANMEWPT